MEWKADEDEAEPLLGPSDGLLKAFLLWERPGLARSAALRSLDALKSREDPSGQTVSQSVKTTQNESTCLRGGCGAREQAAVWIQFRPAAAAPSPSWLGPGSPGSWRGFLYILPVCMCLSVCVLGVHERTVMYDHKLTCGLERVQSRTRALGPGLVVYLIGKNWTTWN